MIRIDTKERKIGYLTREISPQTALVTLVFILIFEYSYA